tara:strand:- start:123 stop:992 length:870 start_codon:yes stop_codon:yes gene_type:complete
MARKVKHSKIKNTGILFELLTRQITADVLAGKSTKSVKLVKKYFNENTELGKELELYRILSEKHYESADRAKELTVVAIKSRKKLSNSKLRTEKYNLIKEIKENYKVNDFFNGRIPNYRILASISNVFQAETTDIAFDPESIVNSKFTVLEHITSNKIKNNYKESKIYKEYSKTDKDLRLLAYSILVDKFNSKYKTLDETQKKLLKNYINNISNTNSLKEYVGTEVVSIKKELKKHLKKVDDDITKIKLNEAVNQVENLTKGRVIQEKQVLTLMRYYELIKELKNVHTN